MAFLTSIVMPRPEDSSLGKLLAKLVLAIASSMMTFGCASVRVPTSYKPPAAPQLLQSAGTYRKEYILRPGDQIDVLVRKVPEVSHLVVIRPDGFITLPLCNDVEASGLTIPELTVKLTEALSKRLLNPEVTVIATQVQPSMVYVLGEVGTPSPIPLRNATTAVQAIAAAGGFRKSAASRDVSIIRLSEDGHLQAMTFNADVHGQPGPYLGLQQAVLKADDIIFVPENGRSQFNRAVQDFLTQPLGSANAIVATYLNFKLINRF